jgi:hypothetical protein
VNLPTTDDVAELKKRLAELESIIDGLAERIERGAGSAAAGASSPAPGEEGEEEGEGQGEDEGTGPGGAA